MATIAERQRTCSYCGGAPFPTSQAFSHHWSRCPQRIRLGYIPVPLDMIPDKVNSLRQQAQKLIREAAAALSEADALEARLLKEAA